MKFITTFKSPNYNLRKSQKHIKHLIIHYTAIKSSQEAINHLCDKKNEVSSHFLIDKSGNIYCLVNEKYRAWHAGISKWGKIKDINSSSIGIELVNSGYKLNFEYYSRKQINSLMLLIKYLKEKYHINSRDIIGHSEISPYRKIDPGPKFPWSKFYKNNILDPYKSLDKNKILQINQKLDNKLCKSQKKKAIYMLDSIGYDTSLAKINMNNYKKLITIYQMRYRKKIISGILDEKTYNLIMNHYNHCLTD